MKKTTLSIFIFLIIFLIFTNYRLKFNSDFEVIKRSFKDTTFRELYTSYDVETGKLIDKLTMQIISRLITDNNGRSILDINIDADIFSYYGLYNFKINENYYGLILRGPGAYSESTKKVLWIYDIRANKIIRSYDLAEAFGDAGGYFDKSSCLYFDSKDNLNLLEVSFSYMPEITDSTLTAPAVQQKKFSLIKINLTPEDTITTDSTKIKTIIPDKFKKLLGK